jgi:gliding motility-associated-like protein
LFPTLLDAQTIQNEITARFYKATTSTIWVRAEAEDLSCIGIAQIMLFVSDVPEIEINDEYIICKNQPIEISGHSSNHRFEWLKSNGDIISTQRTLSFSEPGIFTHIAYKTENGLECSNSKNFSIKRTDPPTFDAIDVVENFKNSHTVSVIVNGDSDYEFSINNTDFFGRSSTYSFQSIGPGVVTVYVRDVHQCEPTIQKNIYIIGYPSFFTPNNDGMNDFWSIKGLEARLYESIQIRIFDRYGKFIADLNSQNNYSWDGNYNGKFALPNDYWFEVVYKTGEVERGHFTLKR